MLKSWSYSRLLVFESCNFRAKLQYMDKILDPSPKTAAERGTAIHLQAEQYIDGTSDTLPVAKKMEPFTKMLEKARAFCKKGKVEQEAEWGFDKNWEPCDYATAWARIKPDALIKTSSKTADVIDFKTGRKDGNEVKHTEQIHLYTLAAFIRDEKLQTITSKLWYFDQGEVIELTTDRESSFKRWAPVFNRRGLAVTNCKDFKPNPNVLSCQYCPYKPSGTGDCTVGVENAQASRNFYRKKNAK